MGRRAVVLGGGGVIGVAFETGLVLGLRDEGIDLREADLFIGTSAGSMVGARLAAGQDLEETPEPPEGVIPVPPGGFDLAVAEEVSELWRAADPMTPALARRIGALALEARTCARDVWVATTGGSLGLSDWPDPGLLLTAVDVATGERMAFDRDSGLGLAEAVAASCAIPGYFPPIAWQDTHYIDGGVASGTHADLALTYAADHVLVLATMCERVGVLGPFAERGLRREVHLLESKGADVVVMLPSQEDVVRLGPELMDATRAMEAIEVGRTHARELARSAALKAWL